MVCVFARVRNPITDGAADIGLGLAIASGLGVDAAAVMPTEQATA